MSDIGNIISGLSTNIPLAAAASFVSEAYVVGQFNSLTVTVKSNQNSSLDVEWSSDGVNWDTKDVYTYVASVGSYNSLVSVNKWVRLRLTNTGAGPQTYLRMATYGVTVNNNVEAILVPQAGGKISSLNIANFPSNTQGFLTNTYKPFRTYSLQGWTSGNSATYTSSDQDMRVYNLGSSGDVIQSFNNGFNTQSFGTGAVGQGVSVYDLYHSCLPMGVLASLQWTCAIEYLGGNNLTTMRAGCGFGTFSSSAPMFARDGIFVTNGVGEVQLYYVVAGTAVGFSQSIWNVDTFTGASNEASSMVLDTSLVNTYKVDVVKDQLITLYILDSIQGKFLAAHIIYLDGVRPTWENSSVGFMNCIRQDTATIPTSTTRVYAYDAFISFNELGRSMPIYTPVTINNTSLATGAETIVDFRNNNALSTLAYESALLRVKTISVIGIHTAGSGIIEVIGYLNANPAGGAYSTTSNVTCTQINNTVTSITPDVNTKQPFYFTVSPGTSNVIDMVPQNVWVRTPENLSIVFRYTGSPSPITIWYSVILEEYR